MSLPGVALGYRAFRLPRQGHGLEECQDAWAVDVERGRFAIADGAAESPYSSLWAKLLVEEFVRLNARLPSWADWLPSLQERWLTAIRYPPSAIRYPASAIRSPFADSGPRTADGGIPWYLEPGLNQGAFATFLGLVIEDHNWYASAVGDSCLFQIRHDGMIRAFPVTRAADFNNAPWLIGSRTSPREVPHKNGLHHLGDCQSGDRLLLMTDALAQWFLAQTERNGKPWMELVTFAREPDDGSGQQVFADWIEGLRRARQLRNDDVTLLAVSV